MTKDSECVSPKYTTTYEYGNESNECMFTYITDDNYKGSIFGLCDSLVRNGVFETNQIAEEIVNDYAAELSGLLELLPRPYTIVQEFYYIDASYRDTYYAYFSNQHFQIKRYSRRLTFFYGHISESDFFAYDKVKDNTINERFMGACVINPLATGLIGRTLLYPKYVLPCSVLPVYIRLSEFELNVYGRRLLVKAFPYRMQDEETMRCAEVTLLNLLDYYSNSHRDYKRVSPSEILESEQKHNHERVLPSKGISYPILTKVLSEFGFSPRLYNLSSMNEYILSRLSQEDELKRCLHYYIESGIPVALNLLPAGDDGPGHSMVCIGHGKISNDLRKKAKQNKWVSWDNKGKCHPLIDSADFYDKYIVVDDNQPVYQVKPFCNLASYPDMRVENVAVPLYKRMFLDAFDAASIVRSVLHNEQFGIDIWSKDYLEEGEDIVIRLFMASSRRLKSSRSNSMKSLSAAETYAIVPMPRFVWVCELYREVDYDDLMVFGEIVVDATSAVGKGQSIRGLILMHYPGVIGIRNPEQISPGFDEMIVLKDDCKYKGYRENLCIIDQE